MVCKSFDVLFKIGGLAVLQFLFLFGDCFGWAPANYIGSILSELLAVLRDVGSQRMVFLCLGFYFIVILFFRWRSERGFPPGLRSTATSYWLVYPFGLSAGLYALHSSTSAPALTLFAGAVLGQGAAFWVQLEAGGMGGRSPVGAYQIRKPIRSASFSSLSFQIPFFLVLLLAWASVWNGDFGPTYSYQAHARWTGAWDNPNLFGLLMGTGLLLAIGGTVYLYQFSIGGRAGGISRTVGKYLGALLCRLAAMLLGRGLLHSYSRGAWLATGCGGTCWLWRWINRKSRPICESDCLGSSRREEAHLLKPETDRASSRRLPPWSNAFCISPFLRLNRNWITAFVVLLSVAVLFFWQFRRTDWHPARRAFSVARTEDFSWRNRVAAWEGDWQIMAEHPWFGTGWNQPEPLYEHYYLSPKLTESAAIQMNDYLLLGAALGVPALFCFGMYVWLTLGREGAGCGARGRKDGRRGQFRASLPRRLRGLMMSFCRPRVRRGRWFCWWGSGLMAGCSSCPRRRRFGFCWSWGRHKET